MNGFDLSTITGVYFGSTQYNAIYYGSTKIWPSESVVPPVDSYLSLYFTIESLVNNNTITVTSSSSSNTKTISVSTDSGLTWSSYTTTTSGITIGTINQGEKLLVKGSNARYGTSQGARNVFTGSGDFKVYGNIMSLFYNDSFESLTTIDNYSLVGLFRESSHLVDAENLKLPATTANNRAYMDMFKECTNLVTPPELPATVVEKYAYQEMFRGCSSMTSVPNLPAQVLAEHCYEEMFRECSSITTPPIISATTLDEYCCSGMFRDCTSITTAPELLAATLVESCYNLMFEGCTKLNYVKCLATSISAQDCTTNWLRYVAATGTFVKDSSNTSWSNDASGIPSGWTISSE